MRHLLAYADQICAQPGEKIEFKVSADLPGEFEFNIVHIRCGDDSEGGPGLKQNAIPDGVNGLYPARYQKTQVGSFIALDAEQPDPRGSFRLEAKIWPTIPGSTEQAIIGAWSESDQAGYCLYLDQDGALAAKIGDGVATILTTGMPLHPRRWYSASFHWNAEAGKLSIQQCPLDTYAVPGNTEATAYCEAKWRQAATSRFLIAGWSGVERNGMPLVSGLFNGKIDSPAILQEILAGGQDGESGFHYLGKWDFSQEISSQTIVDVSENGFHGYTVNLPARAMKGWNHDGSEMNWRHKPAHYGAIHFHEDDLYDCAWQTDVVWQVPEDFPSGTYGAYLTQQDQWFYVPFYIRPKKGTTNNRICLLISTASYYAYANNQMPLTWGPLFELSTTAFTQIGQTDLHLKTHPEHGLSMYDVHSDGSGVCYASRLRPFLRMGPKDELWQYNADTHITDWLEQMEIGFDVVTDDDLDREGVSLLQDYACVMTTTHPEYYSRSMIQGLLDYQQQGGRFIYLGGNGFYWRIAYHPELPGVIEMRRAEDGMRSWIAEPGEYHMSFTGELSGLWRRNGIPPEAVCGTGFSAQGFNYSKPYYRTEASYDSRVSWIFEGLPEGESIGDFGLIFGGAAGSEIDSADFATGTPPHALIVAEATDFGADYHWVNEEFQHTHSAVNGETCPDVRCDMVFYETPNNGAVFSVSSIAFAGSLSHNNYDNNVSRLLGNVMRRFISDQPE